MALALPGDVPMEPLVARCRDWARSCFRAKRQGLGRRQGVAQYGDASGPRQPDLETRWRFEWRNNKTDPASFAKTYAGNNPAKQIGFLIDLFLQDDIADDTKTKLVDYYKQAASRSRSPRPPIRWKLCTCCWCYPNTNWHNEVAATLGSD